MQKYRLEELTMEFSRKYYLNKLVDSERTNIIKVITGLRRSGKSYLLFEIFKKHLLEEGVSIDHIIDIRLDNPLYSDFRDSKALFEKIKSLSSGDGLYYVLLDEIQLVPQFEETLNGLLYNKNLDIYVTGSNSRFLSSDIVSEFRGRSKEIRVYPLAFSELKEAFPSKTDDEVWNDCSSFGGMPYTYELKERNEKAKYLKDLFNLTYLDDISERYNLANDKDLLELTEILASDIGGLTNPKKLSDSFNSRKGSRISDDTVSKYIDHLQDAFLVEKAQRYDVRGKRYIGSPFKYYFTDIGIRNAVLDFRQLEQTHIMENVIFNELKMAGYSVDIGNVFYPVAGKNGIVHRQGSEIDFVVNSPDGNRVYIQSAFSIPDSEKMLQEKKSLSLTKDSFRKIIVCKDDPNRWFDEEGILHLPLFMFLLNPSSFLE
jgi:predicted AAA+ superfamily ATPase